jgi:hypothetical protein
MREQTHADRVKPKGARPTELYKDQGMRAVQWHNTARDGSPYESVQIERSIPKRDGEGFDKEVIHISEKHFDGIIAALQQAKEAALQRQETQGQSR